MYLILLLISCSFDFLLFYRDRALDYLHRTCEKYHINRGLDTTQMKGGLYTEINTCGKPRGTFQKKCVSSLRVS